MANGSGEPIGEIDVLIGGDYSGFSDALQEAIAAAQTGGKQIAEAFEVPGDDNALVDLMQNVAYQATAAGNQMSLFAQEAGSAISEVSQQLSLFDTNGLEGVTGGFDAIGVAASDSVAPMQAAADAASGATEEIKQIAPAAQEAESGLGGMAEQLTAIGEALVITEGLKEFGQEALTAAGTVQSVTIGLTALTGSAEQADEIVEKIKDLAATEPFAFPEIAPTVPDSLRSRAACVPKPLK